MDLDNRRALVTGAGRGIGRAVALALGRAGAAVAVSARTQADVDSCAAEVRAAGGRAMALSADVSRVDDVQALFQRARAELGGVDILVNGAGIAVSAQVHRTSDEEWRAVLETNLSGTFYAMREALPEMMQAGWGRVINMASIAGKTGYPYIGAYAATKHGVLGLTRCAALEGAAQGVTVNAVCPGYVDTPMTDAAIANVVAKTKLDEAAARRHLEETSPQKRMVTVEEVAALTLFLCSEEARGINGQALGIDGGTVV